MSEMLTILLNYLVRPRNGNKLDGKGFAKRSQSKPLDLVEHS